MIEKLSEMSLKELWRLYLYGNRISFNKGYTETEFAEKVFHVHLRYMKDNDELYFRDYLNQHSAVSHKNRYD